MHLSRGSLCPTLIKNSIRIYSMVFCPFAQRVLLVAEHGNIKHDVVNINLTKKPDWFLEKFPKGSVPVIEFENGEKMTESVLISEYLCQSYAKNLIDNAELKTKYEMRIISNFDETVKKIIKFFFSPLNNEDLENTFEMIFEDILNIQENLKDKFFGGSSVKLVDFMLWPFFERLEVIPHIFPQLSLKYKVFISSEKYKKIFEWYSTMKNFEACKKTYIRPEHHLVYMNSRRDGNIIFDGIIQ